MGQTIKARDLSDNKYQIPLEILARFEVPSHRIREAAAWLDSQNTAADRLLELSSPKWTPRGDVFLLDCGSHSSSSEERIKEGLHDALSLAAKGVSRIRLHGCDDLDSDSALRFVQELNRQGYAEIELYSGGWQLKDEAYLEQLLGSGITGFTIWVFSSSEMTHDAITGKPGSFAAIGAALRNLMRRVDASSISVASCILPENHLDLPKIYELAARYACSFSLELPSCLSCLDSGDLLLEVVAPCLDALATVSAENGDACMLRLFDIPYCIAGGFLPNIHLRRTLHARSKDNEAQDMSLTLGAPKKFVWLEACATCDYAQLCCGFPADYQGTSFCHRIARDDFWQTLQDNRAAR